MSVLRLEQAAYVVLPMWTAAGVAYYFDSPAAPYFLALAVAGTVVLIAFLCCLVVERVKAGPE